MRLVNETINSIEYFKEPRSLHGLIDKILVHQANCHHVMGGGIALAIKNIWPIVYEADKNTPVGPDKLGTFSKACVQLPVEGVYSPNKCIGERTIYNLYGQDTPGSTAMPGGRATLYDALHNALCRALSDYVYSKAWCPRRTEVVVPKGIGCGLALGDWFVVDQIIISAMRVVEKKFSNDNMFDLTICELPCKKIESTNT